LGLASRGFDGAACAAAFFAGFDTGFTSYGAMLKAHHAAMLDPEYPPSLY